MISPTEIAAWGTGAGTFLGSFALAVYAVIRRVRKNAKDSAKNEHEDTQKKIDKAVADERKRAAEVKQNQADVVKILQDAVDGWKDLAAARAEKNVELNDKVQKLTKDLAKLRLDHNKVLEANAIMTVEMDAMKKRLELLESIAKGIKLIDER